MAKVRIDPMGDPFYPECPFYGEHRPQFREDWGNDCAHPDMIGVRLLCSVVCKPESMCHFDK